MPPRPALGAAAALNVVLILLMGAVLAVPVMAPAVAADTGLSTSLLGLYSFLMWTPAMLGAGMVGKAVARFGAVRVTQALLVLCALALAGGASGLTIALAATPALIGIACALETPASSDILARVTPAADQAVIFSLKQTGVPIGGVLAGVAFPAALPALGWRGAMAALAAMLLAWAVALEPMRRELDARAPAPRPAGSGPSGFSYIRRTPALRDLATVSFVFHAMQVCLSTFLVAFLVEEHRYSLASAGLMLAAAQLGGFFGRVGFGFIAGPRLTVMKLLVAIGIGMTVAAVALALAAGQLSAPALGLLCFLFGLTASGWNGVFLAEVVRHAPAGEIARVTGGIMLPAFAGLILGPLAFSAASAAAASFGAGYLLVAAAAFAGTLVLHRGRRRPRAV